ncbi:MAG: nucleotidyltransferase family protein [Bacteroidetes bacterium]|nr:nucleotidyltransferase family protein [Bacteroidota bacterium]
MNIGIVILAAGSSSRLGQSKQLVKINNETLLQRSIKIALASAANEVLVVLGANAEAHRESIAHLSAKTIYNPDWQQGIGSSIKAGITYFDKKNIDAVIILVCDQVFLKTQHLQKIIANFQENKSTIVASKYKGIVGVPCLFHKSLFNEIAKMNDDVGAKKIITKFSNNTIYVDFPEGEFDVDTLDDLERLRGM